MEVSIIIPVFNKLEYTKKCLEALKKNTGKKYLSDVIVVDNGSTDGTKDYLASRGWVKIITNHKNLGFSGGNNQGAKIAKDEVLLFLNNDTEVRIGWIGPLLNEIQGGAVVVGSKLLFPNGKVQHAGIAISNDHLPRHIYYNDDPGKVYINKKRQFKAVTAACMAIRKEDFEAVGGFDEDYKNGMEDIDLCLKLYEKGKKIVYVPESVVTHYESVSPGRHKFNFENNKRFLGKWSHIEPDEQKYYKEDGKNIFYRMNRELNNRYYSDWYNEKPIPLKLPKYLYMFVQKSFTVIYLLFKGDFKTLNNKLSKVTNGKS